MKNMRQLNFASSTFLSETQARGIAPGKRNGWAHILDALAKHPEPVDIDASRQPWAIAMRDIHPETFSEGGHRICVPLVRQRRIAQA